MRSWGGPTTTRLAATRPLSVWHSYCSRVAKLFSAQHMLTAGIMVFHSRSTAFMSFSVNLNCFDDNDICNVGQFSFHNCVERSSFNCRRDQRFIQNRRQTVTTFASSCRSKKAEQGVSSRGRNNRKPEYGNSTHLEFEGTLVLFVSEFFYKLFFFIKPMSFWFRAVSAVDSLPQ